MCLVALAWQATPKFPLVISANRDEFFERPTTGLHLWPTGFYGGKDMRSGGTWMGFHPNGRWALLTNYRDFKSTRIARISRGKLVQAWLEGHSSPAAYLSEIRKNQEEYDGFNLLVSDGKTLWYFSNYAEGIHQLSPGIYGLSNGTLFDTWPKTELAINQLDELLKSEPEENSLIHILKSTATYPIEVLPQTGLPTDMEIGLSAQMVRIGESYGTVSAMAVVQEASGLVRMKERQYAVNYRDYEDTLVSFCLNKN